MKKSIVIASVLALCSGMACAQPTQPQFYMWGEPSFGWDNDHYFVPMVRVNVAGANAAAAATAVADDIEDFLASGWADAGNIAVLPQKRHFHSTKKGLAVNLWFL